MATPKAEDALAIALVQVTKRYRRVTALDRVSFSVPFGRCLGLVGPNGAGKTTIFRILSGLVGRFEGEATIDGRSVREDRPPVGAIVEAPGFYPYLSVAGNLRYFAAMSGAPAGRPDDVMALLGLRGLGARKAGTLSHGMRQRLGLALALLTGSRVLLLDEPMTGLDPLVQHEVRETLRQHVAEGAAVLISTHNLPEVEALADVFVFLKAGRVLAAATREDILHDGTLSVQIRRAEEARRVIEAAGHEVLAVRGTGLVVRCRDGARGEDVARVLAGAGLYPSAMQERRGSLEDFYLDVMGAEGSPGPEVVEP